MKTLTTIIFTLLLVVAVSYSVIIIDGQIFSDEEEHGEIGETILFAVVIPLYVGFAYWITRTSSKIPIIIAIIGNAVLVILYIIAMSSLSEAILGVESEELSDFGITIKILQLAIIALSIIKLKK